MPQRPTFITENTPPTRASGTSGRPPVQARNPQCATVFTDINLTADGRQVGAFHVPYSPDDDAWGTVRVPLAVLANGVGPTVLLEGGNHGDEYEGQIVLGEMIRDLELSSIQGRLIFIPAINAPAVGAGKRTSPLDGMNLNRVFPGDHAGTVTQQIAAFVNDTLLPRSDAFLSLHSGGSSLDIVPSALVQPSDDPNVTQRNLAAARSFGAPMTVVLNTLGDTRTCVATAVATGLTCVSTEMAGMGTVSRDALALCRRGARNVLCHWGVLDPAFATPVAPPGTLYQVLGHHAYVIASDAGVFEAYHALGEPVHKGQAAGRIHFLTDPGRTPVELHYRTDGVLYARRQPGRVVAGNTCCVVAAARD